MMHRVRGEIVLSAGLTVSVAGRPAQGTKHEVFFGTLLGTGEPVVVKLEGIPGALSRERTALEYLKAHSAPAPRLRASGLAEVSGQPVACLVMTRERGSAPTSRDGWRRLGRALGRLGAPVGGVAGLPVLDHGRFGAEHAQRVRELGDRLAAIASAAPDWHVLSGPEVPGGTPLVLTHGDPGPGNFLDDERNGWLIDWEDAHIAPRGLDVARAVFIARLGSGSAGFVGRDHAARADAVLGGYLKSVPGGWRPGIPETRWWLTVAGVQFIHHRWQRRGRPGPFQDAVAVLQRGLADTTAWQ